MATLDINVTPHGSLTEAQRLPQRQLRIPLLSGISWWLFTTLWIIGFLDMSKDYAILHAMEYSDAFVVMKQYVEIISSAIILALAAMGMVQFIMGRSRFLARSEIKLFLLLFFLANIFGGIVGLIKGVPAIYVLGDTRNLIIYPALFAIQEGMTERGVKKLRRLLLIACGIVTIKLLIFLSIQAVLDSEFYWRTFFKQSLFFMPMLFVGLGGFIFDSRIKERYKNLLLVLLAAFGISATYMRGMFLGTLGGAIYLVSQVRNKQGIYKFIFLSGIIIAVVVLGGLLFQGDITEVFGRWGDKEPIGIEYRWREADMLIDRFGNNWMVGTGLGYFDETSEFTRASAARAYLVELEFHSLLAKLGVIGISLWIVAFFSLFVGCVRTAYRATQLEYRGFVLGLTSGLVALLTFSAFQTAYSSIYFHLYVVMILLVLSALRAPKSGVLTPGALEH